MKEDEVQVRCFQTFSTFLKANDWYKVLKTTPIGIVVEVVASDGVPYGLGFGKDHFGVRAEEDIVVGKSKTPKKKVVAAVVETVVEEPKSLFEVMEVSDSSLEEQEEEIFTESDIYAEDLLKDNVETFDSMGDDAPVPPLELDVATEIVEPKTRLKLVALSALIEFDNKFQKQVDAFGNPKYFKHRRVVAKLKKTPELLEVYLWYTVVSEGIKSFKELIESVDESIATQVGILVDSRNKVVGEYLTTIAEYPIIANIKMLELHDYLDLTNYSDLDFEIIQEFHSQYKILKALC